MSGVLNFAAYTARDVELSMEPTSDEETQEYWAACRTGAGQQTSYFKKLCAQGAISNARRELGDFVKKNQRVELLPTSATTRRRMASGEVYLFVEISPLHEGFNVRCVCEPVRQTKRPVLADRVGIQVDALLVDYNAALGDFYAQKSARRGERERTESVYFIRDESGPIKIGKTYGTAQSRLATLQTGNPRPLALLATTSRFTEAELHIRFAEARISGEWFVPTPDLLALIEELGGVT